MPPASDLAFLRLAEPSHGVVTTHALLATGVTRKQIERAVRVAALKPLSATVFRVVGAPETPEQGAAAATALSGFSAAVSHASAAARWGLPGFSVDPVHVSHHRLHSSRRVSGFIQHEFRKYRGVDVRILHGIRTTTPARTIFDLAASTHPERVARTLDRAIALRLLRVEDLDEVLQAIGGRGMSGTRLIRHLVAERVSPDWIAPESGLEARFQRLWNAAGLPRLERQVHIGDDRLIGRVDFLDRPDCFVVEVQSHLYHSSHTDRQHDKTRAGRIRAAGFYLWEVSDRDIFEHPEQLIIDARQHLRAARSSGSAR